MKPKESRHSQDNPQQKEESWRYHATWLQTTLQGHSNQNSIVLVPKQIGTNGTEQRPQRQPTHLQPSDL